MRSWRHARKLREISTRNHTLREIPTCNRGSTRGLTEVWSLWLEYIFAFSVVRWYRLGKPVHSNGQSGTNGIKDWIAKDLFYLTGLKRTMAQVGSHLQLRRRWFNEMHGNDITWDTCILGEYAAVSDSDLSLNSGGEDDDDDETPPPLVDDSGSTCDSPGPATPPLTMECEKPTSQAAQRNTIRMDMLAARLASLDLSRPSVLLHDGVEPAVETPQSFNRM